jgi:hypothetical protein
MKSGILLIASILLFTPPAFSEKQTSSEEVVSTLKSYVPAISEASIDSSSANLLFGHYTSKPFTRDMPELSGEEVYLFPDKTFYYLEWADILPLTIYDIGTWDIKDGILEFKSDSIITWKQTSRKTEQRKYVPMYYVKNDKKVLLLMGIGWEFPYFCEQVKKDKKYTDYDWMLDINSLNKKEDIGLAEYKKIKEKLFKECWHPDWFTQNLQPSSGKRQSK